MFKRIALALLLLVAGAVPAHGAELAGQDR